MTRPIQVGDLVWVLHGCCSDNKIGHILTVIEIYLGSAHCYDCDKDFTGPIGILGKRGYARWGRPLSWLKRIPPLDELEHDEIVDEVDDLIGHVIKVKL